MNNNFKKTAITAARLADGKKAEAVSIYDMDGRSELADYVVVVTVDNPAQLEAVDDEISISLKKEGLYPLYRDGVRSKNWRVLDYGGFVVHIFESKTRETYSFDKVFAGYSEIKWREAPAAADHKPQAPSRKAKLRASSRKAAPKKAKAAPKSPKKGAKKAPVRKPAPKKKKISKKKITSKKKK